VLRQDELGIDRVDPRPGPDSEHGQDGPSNGERAAISKGLDQEWRCGPADPDAKGHGGLEQAEDGDPLGPGDGALEQREPDDVERGIRDA